MYFTLRGISPRTPAALHYRACWHAADAPHTRTTCAATVLFLLDGLLHRSACALFIRAGSFSPPALPIHRYYLLLCLFLPRYAWKISLPRLYTHTLAVWFCATVTHTNFYLLRAACVRCSLRSRLVQFCLVAFPPHTYASTAVPRICCSWQFGCCCMPTNIYTFPVPTYISRTLRSSG